jgi:hypothetical protein
MSTTSSKITYVLEECFNKRHPFRDQKWDVLLKNLSEEDMRRVAKTWKFNLRSVEKLITHKSKSFTRIKKGNCEITKVFHESNHELWKFYDRRQPLNKTPADVTA